MRKNRAQSEEFQQKRRLEMDKGAKIEYNTLMRKNEEGVALVRKKNGFENLVLISQLGLNVLTGRVFMRGGRRMGRPAVRHQPYASLSAPGDPVGGLKRL